MEALDTKTLKGKLRYFDYSRNIEMKVKEKMFDDQRKITAIISSIIFLFFFLYLVITYTADAYLIFTRLFIFLILLTISSTIFKRTVLPIGKVSKNKIKKMCEYLYLPERSPEYTLLKIKNYNELIERERRNINKLKTYLQDIEISDDQKLTKAQKVIIDREKIRIMQLIEEKQKIIDETMESIAYTKIFLSFLQKVFTE